MFLKNVTLTNFRNYSDCKFEFNSQITVLVGDNAQGKSNFLESIYFLATTKSPKAERDEEVIKNGESILRVEGLLDTEISLEIAMQLLEGKLTKRIKVNGVGRKVSDYSANLAVVLFSPEDVNLVTGSPSLRRAHLDQTISQVHKEYKRALSNYENIVIRKNRLLKSVREGQAKLSELDFWYDQQILLGGLIVLKREEFFSFINSQEKKFGNFKFEYLENALNSARLKEYQKKEVESASSLIGPHRDDFLFKLNDIDLSKFGSRGEQRTAVLDLKLTEVEYFESVLNNRPILLLDDIFSELDVSHRQHVIDISKMQQTIIATVDWDDYLAQALSGAKIVQVKNGKLIS